MLVRAITGQQLSVKAAASIWQRLLDRFGGHAPTPEQILADDPEELRVACGFSRAKVAYLRSLAEHVISGELELDRLPDMPDGEVIRELTAVKGIGEWTAHMFLMFTLDRPDVLATGDLGVRNAAMRAYGLERPPAPAELTALAEPWRPVPHARVPIPLAQPGQRAGALTRLPSSAVMRRLVLAVVLACALPALAGCGGDDGSTDDPVSRVSEEGGLQENVRAASQPKEADFPSADGKTLNQIAEEVRGGGSTEVGLATSVFTVGEDRLAFGMIDDQGQFVYGPTVVYVAPTPDDPAEGPFVAPADVLVTEGRYRSRQAAEETDPFAAVYQAQVPFDQKGRWAVLAVTKSGNTYLAAPSEVQVNTKKADEIPDVGEPAPKAQTDTLASVQGNEDMLDTRVPPSDMHAESFADVVGKKPVALLFSTPQLCQSRVCGPVTDIALQLKAKYGDQMEFIHQEVYADNDPQKGLRPSLEQFKLRDRAVAVRRRRRRARHRAARGLVRAQGIRGCGPDGPLAASWRWSPRRWRRPRRPPPTAGRSSARRCRSTRSCSPGAPRPCS